MNRMTSEDRQLWWSVRTLQDVGDLTALWLEGKIKSQPGYEPGYGPDPETQPLIGTLAAVNRAGYVTMGSQPGDSGIGYDAAYWTQRAAVSGLADEAMYGRLKAAAQAADLTFLAHKAGWRTTGKDAIVVTERWDRAYTRFGTRLSRRHLRDSWVGYGMCPRPVTDAMCEAWQVTIVDMRWDRNDRLWPALDEVAGRNPTHAS
jgi:hypothetical protein